MRFTQFILCNCKELDSNYNHSLYFSNKDKQLKYFLDKKVYLINDCYYHRKDSSIKIEKSIDELSFVNYVLSRNEENGKYYFYFVYDRIYVNDYTTQLILKLDVIQTYLFDMDLNSNLSLVDRGHYNPYQLNSEKLDLFVLANNEGLEVGEYVVKNITNIYDYSNKGGYIVASSDKLTANNGGSSGSVGGNENSFKNGYCSENGFVLIKSMEGFATTPYDIGDGTRTTG